MHNFKLYINGVWVFSLVKQGKAVSRKMEKSILLFAEIY